MPAFPKSFLHARHCAVHGLLTSCSQPLCSPEDKGKDDKTSSNSDLGVVRGAAPPPQHAERLADINTIPLTALSLPQVEKGSDHCSHSAEEETEVQTGKAAPSQSEGKGGLRVGSGCDLVVAKAPLRVSPNSTPWSASWASDGGAMGMPAPFCLAYPVPLARFLESRSGPGPAHNDPLP